MDDDKLNEFIKHKDEIEKTQRKLVEGFNIGDGFIKMADEISIAQRKNIEEMGKLAIEDSKHQELMNKITLENMANIGKEERRKEQREQSNADNLNNIFSAIDKQKEDSKIIKTWTIVSAIFIILTFIATIYLIRLSQNDNSGNNGKYKGQNSEVKIPIKQTDNNASKGNAKRTDDAKIKAK